MIRSISFSYDGFSLLLIQTHNPIAHLKNKLGGAKLPTSRHFFGKSAARGYARPTIPGFTNEF
jgi:hypothetical protein